MGFHPTSKPYRYTVLLCACFLIFGNYYVYDLPGALSLTIRKQIPDPFNPGVEMGQSSLNLMYSVYNFPNIVLALLGGIFVDKLGLRTGCFVFVSIILIGQCVVALGASIRNFWLMLVGRVIFAVGGESCAVAQNAFVSRWFKDRELALALGLALSLGRMGSGLNFLTAAQLASSIGEGGLSFTMWFGVILCGVSELACLFLILLDRKAEREGALNQSDEEPEKISLKAVKEFPPEFWVLCLIVVTFYSAVFPFNATAVSLLTDYKNPTTLQPEYDETTAGYIVSIPSFLAVILAPTMGKLVDVVGRRPLLIGVASILLGIAHLSFAFTYTNWHTFQPWTRIVLHPIVSIVIYGFAYGLLAAALFPCVPLVINQMAFIGTAFGLTFSIQNGGLAAITYLMGLAQDSLGHAAVELCFAGFAGVSLLLSVLLFFLDRSHGAVLSSISKDKSAQELSLNDEYVRFNNDEHDAADLDELLRNNAGRRSLPVRSRVSYDFMDLPSASTMVGSHSRVRNAYLNKIGIVGLEGRVRSASML